MCLLNTFFDVFCIPFFVNAGLPCGGGDYEGGTL